MSRVIEGAVWAAWLLTCVEIWLQFTRSRDDESGKWCAQCVKFGPSRCNTFMVSDVQIKLVCTVSVDEQYLNNGNPGPSGVSC